MKACNSKSARPHASLRILNLILSRLGRHSLREVLQALLHNLLAIVAGHLTALSLGAQKQNRSRNHAQSEDEKDMLRLASNLDGSSRSTPCSLAGCSTLEVNAPEFGRRRALVVDDLQRLLRLFAAQFAPS